MNNKTMKVITLVTGILTVLLGFYTIATPFKTFLAIGWILGILILMNGVELILMSLSKDKKEIGACILGVLEVIAGLILLCSGLLRFLTDVTAVYLVGCSVVFYGIFQLVKGVQFFKVSKGMGILGIICGALSIILGVLSFIHPIVTMVSVGYIIAFSVLMHGFNMIVFAVSATPEVSEQ